MSDFVIRVQRFNNINVYQIVFGPLYFRLQGNENLTITYQYNVLLRQCSYPTSIQGAISEEIRLQFWEQIEVRKSHIRRLCWAPILPKPLTYLRYRLRLILLPNNLCPLRSLYIAGLTYYHT